MSLTTDQFNDSWPAAAHESWLCRDAFHRFQMEGQRQINADAFGLTPTKENNIAAYSAYADFIQHLHGTYMALFDMEVHNGHIQAPPKKDRRKIAEAHDNFIRNEADRRQDPKTKISVPKEFGKDLRDIRNRTDHTDHKRTNPKAAGQITLHEFYRRYHHPFVEVLYLQIASGYLDRHAAGGKWDAIEGFSVIAGDAATRSFGLEPYISQIGHFLTTGTSHIRLGLIDETSADLPAAEFRHPGDKGYVLPIHGIPPWDAPDQGGMDVWERSFHAAWRKDRPNGSLKSRLGDALTLIGPQRPQSIIALSGSGLDETKYALRLADDKATLEAITANRSDMETCVREAGEMWHANLTETQLRLVQDQERRIAERDRIRHANKSRRLV